MKAHVSESKKRTVAEFVKYLKEYPMIGVIDVEGLPAPQFQKMREQLRQKVVIVMSKRRLMKIALENVKDEKKGIEELEQSLEGMPAFIFTKESPFSLSKILRKSRSKAPAKAGQIAPKDIAIPAGPTPFAPGPIIGELGSIGLKTGVEGGKVTIRTEKVVAKEGEKIPAKVAEILTRFGIQPMEVGLDLIAAYENGLVYHKDVLAVDEEAYINNIKIAGVESINLAVYCGYISKDIIEVLIRKAAIEGLALQGTAKIEVKEEEKSVEAKGEEISEEELPKEKAQKETKRISKEETKERISKPVEKPEEVQPETEKAEELPEEKSEEKKLEAKQITEKLAELPESPQDKKLKELESVEQIESKVLISDEDMKKAEHFVKKLQERYREKPKPKERVPTVDELVAKTEKFAKEGKGPSAEDILEDIEEKEEVMEEKKDDVPSIQELAKKAEKEGRLKKS